MNLVHITSLELPALAPYARLTEAQLRNRLHPEEGLFICESEKVIRVALAAGMQPVSFLCEAKYIDTQVRALAEPFPGVPVYTAGREVLAALTGYELSRGVLCAMRRPPERGVGEVLGGTLLNSSPKLGEGDRPEAGGGVCRRNEAMPGGTLLSQPQAAASSPNLGEQQDGNTSLREQLDGNTSLREQQDGNTSFREQLGDNFKSSPKLGEGDRPEAGGGVCRKNEAMPVDTLLSQPQAAASSPNLGEQQDGNTSLREQQDGNTSLREQLDDNFNSSPKLGEGDRPEAGGGVCRKRVAVLDGVVNSENTGAIFRAAAALGIDALLLTRTCCDPLNRRACRVSMGTVFQLPWTWLDHYGQLTDLGFSTVALALTDRSVPIDHPSLKQHDRLAIILGTEGDGLSDSVLQRCDHVARIPMQRGVDSLNVAAAAAVAFYELTR